MSANDFDRYASTYSRDIEKTIGIFGKQHDFYNRSKVALLGEAFAELGGPLDGLKVLDVGCGIGLIHPALRMVVGELHGADISPASLDVARTGNPLVRYQTYDGDRLPYDDGEFDCAYAICVMHHVPAAQWRRFSNELFRVVRPGGMVVVIEHNPLNPATRWVVANSPLDREAELVSARTLRGLIRAAGAARVKTSYVLFTPFEGRLFRWLDRCLAWLPLGAQYVVTATTPPSH